MTTVAGVLLGLTLVGQLGPLPHVGSLTDGLRGPARLTVAPDDSIYVSDPLARQVVHFDTSGQLIGSWPVPQGPIGVAAHPDGRIFVSLRDEPKVAVYDSAFEFLEYLGDGDARVSFVGPTDIDVATSTGRIYVVDAAGDKVYGFDAEGSLALTLGSRGGWPGEFIYPSTITVDEPRNRLIVADHDKNRLQVFTGSGVYLQQFGDRLKSTGGDLEGWMPRPQGLAVDTAGRVYLTDALMGTVRVFDPQGVDLGKVVDYGYEAGKLRVPCDVGISNNGQRLYVVSSGSSQVEIYALGTTGSTAASPALTPSADDPLNSSASPGNTFAPGTSLEVPENYLDGPHYVADRPDDNPCAPCHGIKRQPGSHSGTVEGQGVLCMSCHSPGGRALRVPILERDLADPYAINEDAADGRGRSHAWGTPAVNALADSVGPRSGGVMSMYLDSTGNIKCSTCHNQHKTYYGPKYLRISNDGDAMCKQCHAPLDRGLLEGGSHPVGFAYPEGSGEYPTAVQVAPLLVKNGNVECMTCHAPHGADSGGANEGDGDGMLLRNANDETLCRVCHTEHVVHAAEGAWQPTCGECHDIHDPDNENLVLIAQEVNDRLVTFTESQGPSGGKRDYIHPSSFDGVCEVCHTQTDFHRNTAEANHSHHANVPCTECHLHSIGFLATCIACHGDPPDGQVSPNRAGAHAAHQTAARGPKITDCTVCHVPEDSATHDDGVVDFASGVDADLDGHVDLTETDACNTCHSDGGPFDGVNDPLIGAKANWYEAVYSGNVLKPDKADWCLGCHDTPAAVVNDIEAPLVAGDNQTWGYKVDSHGRNYVLCTDCHDPTLSHTDGVARTFSLRFPLTPGGVPKPAAERELDREAYNNGYRLRRIDGVRALAIPRDIGAYNADDFRLCFECHDELILGVPANYDPLLSTVPAHLQLAAGVAHTNYRNESEWGYGWGGHGSKAANIHWDHIGTSNEHWDIDQDGFTKDSRRSCQTCHTPHGTRNAAGQPTPGMTVADLAIAYGVYNDGTTDREYGYIASGEFYQQGGDLYCAPCHRFFGPGPDPPGIGSQTRYYRERLDWSQECWACHARAEGTTAVLSSPTTSDTLYGREAPEPPAQCAATASAPTKGQCVLCHDMRTHRQGRVLLHDTSPKLPRDGGSRLGEGQ